MYVIYKSGGTNDFHAQMAVTIGGQLKGWMNILPRHGLNPRSDSSDIMKYEKIFLRWLNLSRFMAKVLEYEIKLPWKSFSIIFCSD